MIDNLDLVVTANMLRTAIRAKLAAGVAKMAISGVISQFARDKTNARQCEANGIPRLPVEVIPQEQRANFLDALNELPERGMRLPAVPTVHAA